MSVYTEDYLKQKLTEKLNASHVVSICFFYHNKNKTTYLSCI